MCCNLRKPRSPEDLSWLFPDFWLAASSSKGLTLGHNCKDWGLVESAKAGPEASFSFSGLLEFRSASWEPQKQASRLAKRPICDDRNL